MEVSPDHLGLGQATGYAWSDGNCHAAERAHRPDREHDSSLRCQSCRDGPADPRMQPGRSVEEKGQTAFGRVEDEDEDQEKGSEEVKTLSHSKMECFKKCRRKYFWEYVYAIRPEVEPKALRMGSAVHAALDCLKKGGTFAEAITAVEQIYTEATTPGSSLEYEQTTVLALVANYYDRWSSSPVEVVESELRFELPLIDPDTGDPSRDYILTGFIDAIVRMPCGRTAIMEHKTSGQDIEPECDYWRILTLDGQITLYVYAAQRLEYDIDTVLYDVVRKPQIGPTSVPVLDDDGLKIVRNVNGERVWNANGTPRQVGSSENGYVVQTRPMRTDEWAAKLTNDIQSRPDHYFARQEIARLQDDIDELMQEIWDLSIAIKEADARRHYYRTCSRDTCLYCPYRGLCETHFSPISGYVPSGFVRVDRNSQVEEEVTV